MKRQGSDKGPQLVLPPGKRPSNEQKPMDLLLSPLRNTDEREAKKKALGMDDAAVESWLLSGQVRAEFEQAKTAFVIEQTPQLLAGLFAAARAGQSWAWRLILDAVGLTELLRASVVREEPNDNCIISPGFERDLLENVREILGGKPNGHAKGSRPEGIEPES